MCLDTFPQAGNLVDTFHLPMPVAAERHGMSKHKFRSLYTKRGITKWPYRRWPYRLLRPPVASRLHSVEGLLTDFVTCLADKDLRAVPTVVRTDLPTEVPTATLTPVLAVPSVEPTVEPTYTPTQEPTAVTTPATVRVANLETALDGSVKQGNLIERLSQLELNTTGEQGSTPVLERIAQLEAVLGVSGAHLCYL